MAPFPYTCSPSNTCRQFTCGQATRRQGVCRQNMCASEPCHDLLFPSVPSNCHRELHCACACCIGSMGQLVLEDCVACVPAALVSWVSLCLKTATRVCPLP
eukprot:1160804-Pelagomonas_calceolata.AAC.31